MTRAWRLFSCGLDALVVEWDLANLRPRSAAPSLGGAAWALAARPHGAGAEGEEALAAIATDDGAVRLLAAEGGGAGLVFRRLLGRADARALSLAWAPGGRVVYAGFADGCIRALELGTGALPSLPHPRVLRMLRSVRLRHAAAWRRVCAQRDIVHAPQAGLCTAPASMLGD